MILADDKRAKSCIAFQEGLIQSCSRPVCKGCEYHEAWSSVKGRPKIWESNAARMRATRKPVRCLTCGHIKRTCLCKIAKLVDTYGIDSEKAKELLKLPLKERRYQLAQLSPIQKITGRPRKYHSDAERQRAYRERRKRENNIRTRTDSEGTRKETEP